MVRLVALLSMVGVLCLSGAVGATGTKSVTGSGLAGEKAVVEPARIKIFGKWSSVSPDFRVLDGFFEFSRPNKVKLAPNGMEPVEGTFGLSGGDLVIKVSQNGAVQTVRALYTYDAKNDTFLFQYDNGTNQTLERVK